MIVNRTVTASAITGLRVIQGQTTSGISALATSDPGNGDLTAASNTQFTVYNPVNGNSVGLFNTTSGGTIGAAVTASGPLGAGTIGSVALSASGGEDLAGETDTAPSISFAGNVIANRTVTASAISGLRVIQGQTASGISTLATSDPGNGDLTAASNTQFTVYNPANGNSVGLFGATSGGTIGAAVTASGPLGAGTIGAVSFERLRRRGPGRRNGHRPERGLLRPGCHQSHGHFQRGRLRPGPRGGGPQRKAPPSPPAATTASIPASAWPTAAPTAITC